MVVNSKCFVRDHPNKITGRSGVILLKFRISKSKFRFGPKKMKKKSFGIWNLTYWNLIFAGVAQLVERQPSKLNVAGSNPVSRSKTLG